MDDQIWRSLRKRRRQHRNRVEAASVCTTLIQWHYRLDDIQVVIDSGIDGKEQHVLEHDGVGRDVYDVSGCGDSSFADFCPQHVVQSQFRGTLRPSGI